MVVIPHCSIATAIASRAGGEVEVHRDRAGHRDRDVRERAADRRRQKQADVRVSRRQPAESPGQQERRRERAAERQLPAGGIGHAERPPVALGGPHELPVQAVLAAGAVRLPPGAEFLHRQTRLDGGRRGRQRGAERHRDRIRKARRPLPEELPALEAEDAAPDAVQIDGDDRHVEPVDDPLEAALERQQVARPADRALGEDADDVALSELVTGRGERRHDVPRSGGADRDRLHRAHQPVNRPQLVIRLVDHEPDEPLDASRRRAAPSTKRQVIADEQRRAARRHVLLADDPDAVERVREEPETEADQELRNDATERRRSSTSVMTPKIRQIRSADMLSLALHSHNAPDASITPTMFTKLLVAISRPFSRAAARCCSSAFRGTTNKPPKKPTQRQVHSGGHDRRGGP